MLRFYVKKQNMEIIDYKEELSEEKIEFLNIIRRELNIEIFDFIPITIFRKIVKSIEDKLIYGDSENEPKGLLAILENVPTVTDYKRILRSAKKTDLIAYYFILTASYTAMRVSAILQITVELLKESKKNDNYIKIYSKGKYNEVPFPMWLRRELLKWCNERGIKSDYIFPSPSIKGKPYTRKSMWEKVQKATGRARVNLKVGHPHAFRHLLGKEITNELNDNQTVADIFGHESLKTTAQYQQKTKKEISNILNDFRFK